MIFYCNLQDGLDGKEVIKPAITREQSNCNCYIIIWFANTETSRGDATAI